METAVINIQYIDNLNEKLSKFSLRGAARLSFSALTQHDTRLSFSALTQHDKCVCVSSFFFCTDSA
jgi:hypothetical protein